MHLIRRRIAPVLAMSTMVLLVTGPAYADMATAQQASTSLSFFGVPVDTAFVLSVATSYVIPLISSLLGQIHWDSWVLGIITTVIATANGFLTEWAQSSSVNHYDWKHALVISFADLLLALTGRKVSWEKTRLDSRLLQIGSPKAA